MARNTNFLTMSDLAARLDPDGGLAEIVEVASNVNHMIMDAPIITGNRVDGNSVVNRSQLPTGTYRRLYGGSPQEKSRTKRYTDNMGILDSFSEIDIDELGLAPDPARYRQDEDNAFVEGFTQTQETSVFYADETVDEEKFTGFSPRYNTLAYENVIAGGGSSDANSSIWFVSWSPSRVALFTGKNSFATGGLAIKNIGEQRVLDANGYPYLVASTNFKWHLGLTIKDPRYVVRICNLDAAAMVAGSVDLTELMIRAANKLPTKPAGTMIYANKAVRTALDIQIQGQANVNLTLQTYGGEDTVHFKGMPIRLADTLVEDELDVA